MNRPDLLALTADDLSTLSNRGTVSALRELDSGEMTCEIQDEAGDLLFVWSDGINCRFPEGKSVHDAICSSGSVGISRHIIRSVLAYQRFTVGQEPESVASDAEPATTDKAAASVNDEAVGDVVTQVAGHLETWDPGTFTDEDLTAQYRTAGVNRARKRFDQGVLVELTRGAKPTARFLDESCTVRFPVPGDLRYVTADCAESLLSTWVPMAVWAFRQLPENQLAGLLSIQQVDSEVADDTFETTGNLIRQMCHDGLSRTGTAWSAQLSRHEVVLRDGGFVWPAELLIDLLHEHEMYHQHDARFEPQQVVQLVGEWTRELEQSAAVEVTCHSF